MSELSNLLEQTVDRLFQDLARAESNDNLGAPEQARMWEKIEELGIANIFLPEEDGGMNGSWLDASIIFRLCGYYALSLPVCETAIARKLAHDHKIEIPVCPIALGRCSNGIISGNDAADPPLFTGTIRTVSTVLGNSMIISSLPSSTDFDYVLLDPRHAYGTMESTNVAGEARHTYHFENVRGLMLKGDGDGPNRMTRYGAVLRACQSAGALAGCLEKCLQYTGDRIQFGRPLKRFQAVQHQLALLAEEAAAVYSASSAAACAMEKDEAAFEISCAKLRSNQAAGPATSITHQVHGAIGFTREHKLYLHTQRLWAWRSEFGNDQYWAQIIGRQMLDLNRESAWSLITSRGDG